MSSRNSSAAHTLPTMIRASTSKQLSAVRCWVSIAIGAWLQRVHRFQRNGEREITPKRSLSEANDLMFGTACLGAFDQAVDQLWAVVGIEVKSADFALLQRLVRIKRIFDLCGVTR